MNEENSANSKAMAVNIPGIDPEKGIINSGDAPMYLKLLGEVHGIIDEKCSQIEDHLIKKEIKDYTTLVHSLKTTCRLMGAIALSERFFELEKLGKSENIETIETLTPAVLADFRALKPYLEPYIPQKASADKEYDKDEILKGLERLKEYIDDFDLAGSEKEIKSLTTYKYSDELSSKISTLETLTMNLDYDEALELINEISKELS